MHALLLALVVTGALETDNFYKDAVRLYGNVELEAAAALFEKSLPAAADDAERAKVHAWIGLIHAQLGRTEEARAEFKKAVGTDRAVKMPAIAPPDVEAMLEEERLALAPPTPLPSEVKPVDDGADGNATGATGTTTETETAPLPAQGGLPVAALAVGGVGVASLVAAGTLFAIGLNTAFVEAFDPTLFNDEALAKVELAYTEYAIAGALAAVGVGALGAAFFMPTPSEAAPAADAESAPGPSVAAAP